MIARLRGALARVVFALWFRLLCGTPEAAADSLYELWLTLDVSPPPPSAFAAGREIFSERFMAETIGVLAKTNRLDELRTDFLGTLHRRAYLEWVSRNRNGGAR